VKEAMRHNSVETTMIYAQELAESVTGRKVYQFLKISMFIEQQFQHATARVTMACWNSQVLSFSFIFYLSLHHYIRRSSFFQDEACERLSLLFRKGHQG